MGAERPSMGIASPRGASTGTGAGCPIVRKKLLVLWCERLYFLYQAVVRTSVMSAVREWKALRFLSAECLLSSHSILWEWVFTAINAQWFRRLFWGFRNHLKSRAEIPSWVKAVSLFPDWVLRGGREYNTIHSIPFHRGSWSAEASICC